jgi:simple sugar transport system permease protein
MTETLLESSLQAAVIAATPILLAATGELLAEKTGVYNVGIEGIMLLGALAGFIAGFETGSFVAAMCAGVVVGLLGAAIFAFVGVILGGELVIAGLGIVFGALGLTGALGVEYVQQAVGVTVPQIEVPGAASLPVIGPALFHQPVMVYVAFAMPLLAALLLNRTQHGLNVRATGEDPETADALGVNVTRVRVLYLLVGGALAGLGGAFLSVGVVGTWTSNVSGGQGWIAFAIVIFAGWRPSLLVVGALLFGGLGTLGNVGQALGWAVPSQVFSALPFLGTLIVLIAAALVRARSSGGAPWPAALGRQFIRGAA